MLLSMTGHGEGASTRDGLTVVVEVRTINSRYFKLSLRSTDATPGLEPRVEGVIRKQIKRGTVQMNIRIDRVTSVDSLPLNEDVLRGYCEQLQSIQNGLGLDVPIRLDALVALPGVVDSSSSDHSLDDDWGAIEEAIEAALTTLMQMRADEGQAMADDMAANCAIVRAELRHIEAEAPQVAIAYQARLSEKLNKILESHNVTIEPADVVREVGLFAERSDISEEIVRLNSHLDQFASIMTGRESNGRKLDFITQEMGREVNTIGSKANNAAIAKHVVEIKSAIERIREMVQNVE